MFYSGLVHIHGFYRRKETLVPGTKSLTAEMQPEKENLTIRHLVNCDRDSPKEGQRHTFQFPDQPIIVPITLAALLCKTALAANKRNLLSQNTCSIVLEKNDNQAISRRRRN